MTINTSAHWTIFEFHHKMEYLNFATRIRKTIKLSVVVAFLLCPVGFITRLLLYTYVDIKCKNVRILLGEHIKFSVTF